MAIDLEKWKEAKKAKKMTIADIASKANLPKGTVQNIFCGYIPSPRIDTVQAIEKALELDQKLSIVQKLEHRPGVQKIIEESEKFTELGLAAILGMIIAFGKEHPEYLIKY